MKTPYFHIYHNDALYMGRWWLFNPQTADTPLKYKWIPLSIRLHHICQPDAGRDLHDHPFNCRTFILKGGYEEYRFDHYNADGGMTCKVFDRKPGDTATIKVGEYHRISEIRDGGAWTVFVTGPRISNWGFLVKGQKILSRMYRGYK
ncbi:hypothetical protein D3C76_883290 [compost metagenome]